MSGEDLLGEGAVLSRDGSAMLLRIGQAVLAGNQKPN